MSLPAQEVGAIVTGGATVIAASLGYFGARRGGKKREPLSWESVLARLESVEARAERQGGEIDQLRRDRDEQARKITELLGHVGTYREAFRAVWTWADRLRREWTHEVPVPPFAYAEQRAIDAAIAEAEFAAPDDPWARRGPVSAPAS